MGNRKAVVGARKSKAVPAVAVENRRKKPAVKKPAAKKPASKASARESLADRRRKLLFGSAFEQEVRIHGYAEGAQGASAAVAALLEVCPPNQALSFGSMMLGELVVKTGADLSGIVQLVEKVVMHYDRIQRAGSKGS